jgi:hypothetical protein
VVYMYIPLYVYTYNPLYALIYPTQVRMHVEKEDFGGKRLVVINSITGENAIPDDESKIEAMVRCQVKVMALVEEQLNAEAEAAAAMITTEMTMGSGEK